MRPGPSLSSVALVGLVLAVVGFGVLGFGGLLFYYGDVDAAEYRWRGPTAAVVIGLICAASVVALQHPGLRGWLRGAGYLALVSVGSVLAYLAAVTYLGERCDDPAYSHDCGIPEIGGMVAGVGAAVGVLMLVGIAEIVRRSWLPPRRPESAGFYGQALNR